MKRNPLPLIVLVVILALLGCLYGPKVLRGYQFNRTCNSMLVQIRSGNLLIIQQHILPQQQRSALELVQNYAPNNYAEHIRSLKLTGWEWSGADSIRATITCRVEQDGFSGIYQGDLLWVYTSNGWQWDFSRSYAAVFSATGSQNWVKLGDMLSQTEPLR